MTRRRQNALDHVLSLVGGLTPAARVEVANQLLQEATADLPEHIRPALDVAAIPTHQRVALTWRLRDILALPCDLDAAYSMRGGLLALLQELEGASAESVAPLLGAQS